MINNKEIIIFIRKYNVEYKTESKRITINGLHLFHIDRLGINGKNLLLKRYIAGTLFITGCIDIDEIQVMYFFDDDNKIVKFDNLEF